MKKILPASLSLSRQERLIHRDKMIEKMTAEDKECLGIIHWTLVYDFEIASITTNLAQLKEIGYETFTTEQWMSSNFTHSEQDAILKQLFDGLSKINIYLVNTNHLTNTELFVRLVDKVLIEQVRDCPSTTVAEYINMQTEPEPLEKVSERDATLPKDERKTSKYCDNCEKEIPTGKSCYIKCLPERYENAGGSAVFCPDCYADDFIPRTEGFDKQQ